MYLSLDEIQTIQIDHTSRCNLQCPQCARTSGTGGLNPALPIGKDLSVEDYAIILRPFRERAIKLFFCGNFGDAPASPTFIDVLDYCLAHAPDAYFCIVTNGSLHSTKWWEDLAKRLSGQPDSRVCFSIDGLADTNHIYRVHSRFERIVKNVAAFNAAGGKSRWDFLVFEHNQHQIAQAREMAAMLGVAEFNVKNSSRFADVENEAYVSQVDRSPMPVHDRSDNPSLNDFQNIVKTYGTFADYASHSPISCKSKRERSVFVDFEMRVWPCCWIGATRHTEGAGGVQSRHTEELLKLYGKDFNRLDLHGWDVLTHPYFARDLAKSWNCDFDDRDTPRSFTCGKMCGDKYQFSSGYGKNRKIEILRP